MIQKVMVENYKSIRKQSFPLGRLTVLIGENGAGKSNVLEAITIYFAALADKLDNEFLSSRGIRTTDARFMRSAFSLNDDLITIKTRDHEGKSGHVELFESSSQPFVSWHAFRQHDERPSMAQLGLDEANNIEEMRSIFKEYQRRAREYRAQHLSSFLVYSPAYETLRTYEREGQILPIGIKGEGLLSHLRYIHKEHPDIYTTIMEKLGMLGWFSEMTLHATTDELIKIKDRFIEHDELFDLRSVNEGFFYMLFYYTLLLSPHTPEFFAIDNVDASLNPKMCRQLIKDMAEIIEENGKQIILTTHNPAVLDGLNLHDEEQRLLVVKRDEEGHTLVQHVPAPQPSEGPSIKLSEAFLKGYLGGLPENF